MNAARLGVAPVMIVLAATLFLPGPASAQTGAASLTGIVTDQSGASVPGATVTATNQSTNVEFTGATNEAGSYTIASVPIGVYVVKTELTGFKTASTKPIEVEANQTVRLDVKLEIGFLEQTIEVSSETQVLQTENATVGEVISG
ncbi:MAG TPA: carboxypeptidase-like regulatory domain-containing protein, partial [Vicinamibacterales bacterium]|nr:carboxypeptidase-like regulatory domain-containing protein [Vicinamibacterales bacterium]